MTKATSIAPARPHQAGLALGMSPAGRAYLDVYPASEADQPAPGVAARIRKAFQRGSGSGLLHLGASELASTLPPSLAFGRELGHLLMARLCAVPDLDQCWQTVPLEPPRAELEQLANRVPPMAGAEYLDADRLAALWSDMLAAAREEIADEGGNVRRWLAHKHPSWNMMGRVCFHLAENKASEEAPFAFLATYAAQVSHQAQVRHLPLGRALQEYAGADRRDALLALLTPVQRAAQQSPWLKTLVDSGAIFHPAAWTPQEAHRFLQDIPVFEASGIVVRIPDWWTPRQPPRPQVSISVGNRASGLGLQTMLDFDIAVSLDGEPLTAAEWQQLRAAGDGLVRLKGKWVELDRARLDMVLAHWKTVQRGAANGEIGFLQGMRLLAGAELESDAAAAPPADVAEWSGVSAGAWLTDVLQGLRHAQDGIGSLPELKAQLRPYQQEGVRWLWQLNRLGLGGCLADDMGLGKTIQVIALLLLAKRAADPGPHLLVVPASLIANWQSEIARFAPSLRLLVAHPSALPARELVALPAQRLADADVVVTSYGSLLRLPWITEQRWSLVVLDEAQAIKNPGTKQTRAAKALQSRVRLALTGTPVENRLGDLWSLFDFICPGLLGSAKAFSRLAKRMAEDPHVGYAPLRKLVQPYILRRLKSDKRIIADLPDKTELKAYCGLSRIQARLYQEAIDAFAEHLRALDGIQRRGAVLALLMRLKQICNHPSQWLGDGAFAADDSGKFARLRDIAEEVAARQEKLLVFTQFQEMTAPLADFLKDVYGRPGLVLHGATPVKARKALVDDFQREQGPPFFVLSIKAGGTGLNLTAASHVIHFDRWWNPAVENQATDRAYRIGQKRNVLVHKFICRGTVEEKIDALIEAKLGLSDDVLGSGAEVLLSELNDDELLRLVSLDLRRAIDDK